MAEVVIFTPHATLSAQANLNTFIALCRDKLTVFGADLPFDEDVCDITPPALTRGRGDTRTRIFFSKWNGGSWTSKKTFIPLSDPYRVFAKAYFRYQYGHFTRVSPSSMLAALRALEDALADESRRFNIVKADAGSFNRAAQILANRYKEETARIAGSHLEIIATFVTKHCLTDRHLAGWKNPCRASRDYIRIGPDFEAKRRRKLPTPEALEFVAKAYSLASEPFDVVVTAVAAILCCAPSRISEVLSLPLNCEHWDKTSGAFGLIWSPGKGHPAMIKWIPASMVELAKDALGRLRHVTEPARLVARWYQDNPGKIYLQPDLEYLRTKPFLTSTEAKNILGFSESETAVRWLRNRGLIAVAPRLGREPPAFISFTDLERIVVNLLPRGFPILDEKTGLCYGDALFVKRVYEFCDGKNPRCCVIQTVTTDEINDGLGSTYHVDHPSVFDRLGLNEGREQRIELRTHMFRHFLNTLSQGSGINQLDIAKWSGRLNVRQNQAYDHVSAEELIADIEEATGRTAGELSSTVSATRLPVERSRLEKFGFLTAHTTEFGICVHDYKMAPCQLHRDCINCSEHICVKGDQAKTDNIERQLAEAKTLLARAENAKAENYAGAGRWEEHHRKTVTRLENLVQVLNDPDVPNGTMIRLTESGAFLQHNAADSHPGVPPNSRRL